MKTKNICIRICLLKITLTFQKYQLDPTFYEKPPVSLKPKYYFTTYTL